MFVLTNYMSIEYVGILLNPAFNSWNQSLLSACPTNTSQTGKRKATTSMQLGIMIQNGKKNILSIL